LFSYQYSTKAVFLWLPEKNKQKEKQGIHTTNKENQNRLPVGVKSIVTFFPASFVFFSIFVLAFFVLFYLSVEPQISLLIGSTKKYKTKDYI